MKQLYKTWKTRKYRGTMSIWEYHNFRINRLSDKETEKFIDDLSDHLSKTPRGLHRRIK